MSEQTSSNSTLYFLVGGLVVAMLVVGYFAMGSGGAEVRSDRAVSSASVEDGDTDVKLELGKNGRVSGSIEKK